jgi:hypothetical protein
MALAPQAGTTTGSETSHIDAPQLQLFVMGLFFIFGGITSLNDVIIPKLKELFTLNYTQAMLLLFHGLFSGRFARRGTRQAHWLYARRGGWIADDDGWLLVVHPCKSDGNLWLVPVCAIRAGQRCRDCAGCFQSVDIYAGQTRYSAQPLDLCASFQLFGYDGISLFWVHFDFRRAGNGQRV